MALSGMVVLNKKNLNGKIMNIEVKNDQNILVVDDDPLVRKVLQKQLAAFGYNVETANDGSTALDMLRLSSYDLVLTDLQMPRLGGRQLLESMSNDFPEIPKIVLTGYGTNDDIIAALKSGAYDFLYKPIDDFELLEHSIKRAVESKKLREERIRHQALLGKINEIISMLNSGKSTEEIFSMLNISLKKIIPFDGMVLGLLNETNTFLNVENVFFNQSYCYGIIHKGDRFLVSSLSISPIFTEGAGIINVRDLGVYVKGAKGDDVLKDLLSNGINSILFVPLMIGEQARGILFFVSAKKSAFADYHITFVESIAGQISLSVQRAELMKEIENNSINLEKQVKERTEEIRKTQRATIFALSSIVEARDFETGNHLERMRNYSVLLMQLYKYREDHAEITGQFLKDLYDSSVLHDIGKVGIPDNILLKKGSLSVEEFEKMKTHTQIGYNALKKASHDLGSDSFLNMAMDIVLFHHERWDGAGYPVGLKGENIPLSARVVSIGDVYDALTSERPYKRAFSHEEAVEVMKGELGKFDPYLFSLFLKHAKEFDEIRIKYSDEIGNGK
ncbi:MAG: HD domain-containing phosphohydrolase [Spirochaetota bacterium]